MRDRLGLNLHRDAWPTARVLAALRGRGAGAADVRPRPAPARRTARRALGAGSVSACHWTREHEGARADPRSASAVPSRARDDPQAGAGGVDGLVVEGVDATSVAPAICARREPAARARRGSATVASSDWRWPATCWCSVPPRATFSAWAPRQMPSSGSPAASAARATRELEVVDAGVRRVQQRVARLGAVGDRVEIGPAREADAVQALDQFGHRGEVDGREDRPGSRRRRRSRAGRWCRA